MSVPAAQARGGAAVGLPPGVLLGPLGRRAGAFVIDLVLPVVLLVVALVVGSPLVWLVAGVLALGWWLVCALLTTRQAAGPGQRALGLQVVALRNGRPLPFSRVLGRSLVLLALTVTVVGLLIMVFLLVQQRRRQGWHDLAAGSVVIVARALAPRRPGARPTRPDAEPVPASVPGSEPADERAENERAAASGPALERDDDRNNSSHDIPDDRAAEAAEAVGVDARTDDESGDGDHEPVITTTGILLTEEDVEPRAASSDTSSETSETSETSDSTSENAADDADGPVRTDVGSPVDHDPVVDHDPGASDPRASDLGTSDHPAAEGDVAASAAAAPESADHEPGDREPGVGRSDAEPADDHAAGSPDAEDASEGEPTGEPAGGDAPVTGEAPPPQPVVPPGPTGPADPAVPTPGVPSELPVPADALRLVLDDARVLEVRRLTLLGRNPQPGPDDVDALVVRVRDQARTVSKLHLAIEVDEDGSWVVDRESTNGSAVTTAEGVYHLLAPNTRYRLSAGEVIAFGDHRLLVRPAD